MFLSAFIIILKGKIASLFGTTLMLDLSSMAGAKKVYEAIITLDFKTTKLGTTACNGTRNLRGFSSPSILSNCPYVDDKFETVHD